MSQWSFIIPAYVITLIGTAVLCWQSFRAMRRAEARAEALRERE